MTSRCERRSTVKEKKVQFSFRAPASLRREMLRALRNLREQLELVGH